MSLTPEPSAPTPSPPTPPTPSPPTPPTPSPPTPPTPSPPTPVGVARHRSGTPSGRWAAAAPLAALTVTGLLSARTLRATPLPGDGALTAPAWSWLHGSPLAAPLSPDGLATVLTAGWATATRAFDRHTGLVEAGRELLWVTLLVSGLLLWVLCRRAGLGAAATALALLVLGAIPGWGLVHAVSSPAALAVPWLVLAGCLVTGRRRGSTRVAGLGCLVPAVLLAPDVALLLVATGAGALATGQAGRTWPSWVRVPAAGLLAPVFVGVVLVLPGWDPQPGSTAPWPAGGTTVVLLTGGLLIVGALGAWVLPRWRPLAAALAVTTLAVVAPPGRLSAVLVCLPVAAVVTGALAQRAAGLPAAARLRPALAVAGTAGLVAAVGLAALAMPGTPVQDFGAADRGRLLSWMHTALPRGTPLDAGGVLGAELQRAGAVLGPGGLEVTRGVPPGTPVIASFGSSPDPLVVTDPDRATPTAEQQELRRRLADALLAGTDTVAAGRPTAALRSADVDPRLLTLLAGLSAQFGVTITALPDEPGETGTAIRRAGLERAAGVPFDRDPAELSRVTEWIWAQRPPYAPATVTLAGGQLVLGFHYASDPDGLVAAARG